GAGRVIHAMVSARAITRVEAATVAGRETCATALAEALSGRSSADRSITAAAPAITLGALMAAGAPMAAGALVAGRPARGADASIDAAEVAGTRAPKKTMDRPSEASALRRARFWLNRLLPTRTSRARDGDGGQPPTGRNGGMCRAGMTTAGCREAAIFGCRFPCWGLARWAAG